MTFASDTKKVKKSNSQKTPKTITKDNVKQQRKSYACTVGGNNIKAYNQRKTSNTSNQKPTNRKTNKETKKPHHR